MSKFDLVPHFASRLFGSAVHAGFSATPENYSARKARLATQLAHRRGTKDSAGMNHHSSYSFFGQTQHGIPRHIYNTVRDAPAYFRVGTDAGILTQATAGLGKGAEIFRPFNFTHIQGLIADGLSESTQPSGTYDYRHNRFVFDKVNVEVMFRNLSTESVRLFVYDLAARHDGLGAINEADVANIGNNPLNVYNEGLCVATNTLDTTDLTTNISYLPHHSKTFRQYWKTKKLSEIFLSPGETHIHKHVWAPHLYTSVDRFSQYPQDSTRVFGGLTHSIFAYAFGVPVSSDASPNVTLSPFKLSYVYRFEYISRAVPITNYEVTGGTSNLGSSITALGSVNEDTAAKQTPSTAP